MSKDEQSVCEERRNDIGFKVTYIVLTALISILITIIMAATYYKAGDAYALGTEAKTANKVQDKDIDYLKENIGNINGKLDNIPKDIKIELKEMKTEIVTLIETMHDKGRR